jgi:hypothetical protein
LRKEFDDGDSKKHPFGNEWTYWGCGEKGNNLSQCRKTQKKHKDIRSGKIAVSLRRKWLSWMTLIWGDWPFVDEKILFPYILDSGAVTAVVPKL